MMRDITIGQYYPVDSILHRMDPRVKLLGTLLFIVSLFLTRSWTGYGLVTLFLACLLIMSRIPLRFILKGLKAVLVLLFITMFFNMIFTPGEILYKVWIISITREGVRMAGRMGVRLIYLIIGASLMTLTTSPNHLTDGLERLMRPLEKIGVPVHDIAMMMSIALRFIPILMEEADKIMKAQIARGADFESTNIIKKVKSMIPLLVPLFISAFRRAGDLALAMEARGYNGGQGRTQMKPLSYQRRDCFAYLLLAAYFAGVIALRILSGVLL